MLTSEKHSAIKANISKWINMRNILQINKTVPKKIDELYKCQSASITFTCFTYEKLTKQNNVSSKKESV